MRKSKPLIGIGLLIFAALACNALAPNAAAPTPAYIITEVESVPTQTSLRLPISEADVPRVSLGRAAVAFSAGEAIFVDVRSVEAYAARHIPGALSIPLQTFETSVGDISLPKDQWIITYCT